MQATLQVGDRVLAWSSGQSLWCPATIEAVDTDRCQVKFDDAVAVWAPADQVRPLDVQVGQRVQGRWRGGSTYYAGTIDGKDGARAHVAYDDGDQEWTEVGMLRVAGGVPPSARPHLVWTNSAAGEDRPSLVYLTSGSLTLATIAADDLDRTAAALAAGESIAAQVIPLDALVSCKADVDGPELTVAYRTGQNKTASATVEFANSGALEGFLAALLEQQGPGWQRRQVRTRSWSDLWILVAVAIVALLTWLGYVEASRIAAGQPALTWGKSGKGRIVHQVLRLIEDLIGATGVLIVGGALAAVGLLLFVWVMVSPPRRLVVEPARSTATG